MQPKKILYENREVVAIDTAHVPLLCEMYGDYKFLKGENGRLQEVINGKDREIMLAKRTLAQDSTQNTAAKETIRLQADDVYKKGKQITGYKRIVKVQRRIIYGLAGFFVYEVASAVIQSILK